MRVFQRIIGVAGLVNLGVVSDSDYNPIFRSAKPPDYSVLYQLGIGTVLDLQDNSDEELAERERLCKEVGIKYTHLRMNVLSNLTVDDFDLAVDVLANPLGGRKLVHCLQGHDRTGVVCGAYRLRVDGWTLEEAMEELDAYGFNRIWFDLKNHLEKYATAKGFPLC